jgi:uncharacterized protein YqjF (DUF2071 family)
MHHTWDKLLFIHWKVPVNTLRALIPEPLEIDTFDGEAWAAITPFTMRNVRPVFLPAVPGVSEFHEVNVRTYVHLNGVPGVWFFSLDTNSRLTVAGARMFYHLPYYQADISMSGDAQIEYQMERGGAEATLDARSTIESGSPAIANPGTLEFFLTERYCLYTEHSGSIYRCRINHEPWPLRPAKIEHLETDLFAVNGLPESTEAPHVIAGGPVHVEVWPIEAVT